MRGVTLLTIVSAALMTAVLVLPMAGLSAAGSLQAGKRIGPTFGRELRAAGLTDVPFTWQSDGTLRFADEATAEQIAAVQALVRAHDSTKALPDGKAFEQAFSARFPDILRRNTLLAKYPLFLQSVREGQWEAAKILIDDAMATGTITNVEHDAVVADARTAHIPGF